jgi:hypothetical protein
MTNYKKTALTSPKGLFIGREQKESGIIDMYWKPGQQLHPLFTFNPTTNRFKYVGGIAEISPEALADLANFGAAIFDNK